MSQKNLLPLSLSYAIRLSALSSAIIVTFSFGLAVVLNNANPPTTEKQVLGKAEVLDLDSIPQDSPSNPELPPGGGNPQNPDNPNNNQNPIGNPGEPSNPGNNTDPRSTNPVNTNTPIFESDTVICYQVQARSGELNPIRNPTDPNPSDPRGSGVTTNDPDKFSPQVVCYPKTNNQQSPATINNSNIFNAGSGSSDRCPDVYISTTQPNNNPIIPNIYINSAPDRAPSNLQSLNQTLSCETNFPWWIVVLLGASLASLLIYLN